MLVLMWTGAVALATAVAFHTRDIEKTQRWLSWMPYVIWPLGALGAGVVGGSCVASGVCTTSKPGCTWPTHSLPNQLDTWALGAGLIVALCCLISSVGLVMMTTSASETARERVLTRFGCFLGAFVLLWCLLIPSGVVRQTEINAPLKPAPTPNLACHYRVPLPQ